MGVDKKKIGLSASLCRVSCEVHYRELSSSQETSTEFERFHDGTRCRVYIWISLHYPDDLALAESYFVDPLFLPFDQGFYLEHFSATTRKRNTASTVGSGCWHFVIITQTALNRVKPF